MPKCVSCELDDCDPRACYRVTTLIRAGRRTNTISGEIEEREKKPTTRSGAADPKFSTTIKKKYWEMKVQDQLKDCYFYEFKNQNNYWNPRIKRLLNNLPCKGVFLVGKEPKYVRVLEITEFAPEHIPERYADVITTDLAWALKCEWYLVEA